MEILELNLTAFGPFTERHLQFAQEMGAIHIVYGPNEAGKSSALRGLKALLYGIDERTSDNFNHVNNNLRVGGRLRAQDGRELAFVRRKGRKKTLRDRDGKTLEDSSLVPFLQGASAGLFAMLLGIDREALVQGGQEILEQKGEVGQALFSASLGNHALRGVLAKLDSDADELFKPRGSTPLINAAIKEHAELINETKRCSLSSGKWDECRRELEKAGCELDKIQSQITIDRTEVTRLERIQRCLPRLARRDSLRSQLGALSDVVVLPEDFAERHRQAASGLDKARSHNRRATTQIQRLEEEVSSLDVRQDVIEADDKIGALHTQLGVHSKALRDRPNLEAHRRRLEADVTDLVKQVRPGLDPNELETLRPALSGRVRINTLSGQCPDLMSRMRTTTENLRATNQQLQSSRKNLAQLPTAKPSNALRRAITAARKAGDLDGTIQSTQTDRDALKVRCETDLARLTLWSGSLQALAELRTPARESLDQFEDRYTTLIHRIQRLDDKQTEAANKARETTRRLNEIHHAGTVPNEQELEALRDERDQAWQLVRRRWLDNEDVDMEAKSLDAEHALPEAFEVRMSGSDELADRMRREAERVHAQAGALAEQEMISHWTDEIARRLEQCESDKQQLDGEWQALWQPCDVKPRTPREMRGWLENLEELREQVASLDELERRIAELKNTRNGHMRAIREQVNGIGGKIETYGSDSFEIVLLAADEIASKNEDTLRRRESLEETIRSLQADAESNHTEKQAATDALAAWKKQWASSVKELGLASNALLAEATDIIEKLRDLFAKHHEMENLQSRIKAIDEEAESFQDQAADLVVRIAPELKSLPIDEAVSRLNSLLADSQNRLTKRQQIDTQLTEAREDKRQADETIETVTTRLDVLCKESGCDDHAGLDAAERRSDEFRELKKQLKDEEKLLLEAGEGATLEALECEAKEIEPDILPVQIQTLTDQIGGELEPERMKLAEAKGGLREEFKRMTGSEEAAALADQAQRVLAGIQSKSERYVRLKLAARILRDEIERYREANQGPLIKCASEYFATLTQSSFTGLRADFNDKDEPVLVGLRPNEEQVRVEGMSEGTRDQLYLALRLAALESYIESAGPMPFIVDDILVDFDDKRSEAAMNTLSRLAKKTQVILFTHHSRIVEQAQGLQHAQAQIHQL